MLSREGAPDERGYRLRRMLAGARSIQQMPAGHSLNIALRTYTLALSLSLGPTLVSLLSSKKLNRGSTLKGVLAKHLSPTAFPFAITLGVTAGAWLNASRLRTSTSKRDHDNPEEGRAQKTEKYAHAGLKALAPIFSWFSSLDEERKVFICNLLSSTLTILLLRSGNKRIAPRRTYETLDLPLTLPEGRPGGRVSPTLDLTLLLFVRALDSLVQRVMSRISSERATVHPVKHLPGQDTSFGDEIAYLSSRKPSAQRRTWTGYVDAFTFWSSSSRFVL